MSLPLASAPGPGPAVRLERIVPFLVATVFLDLVGFGIILPLLPSYISEMGGTPQTVGLLLATFSVSQLLATPVLGRASDRHGRRRVILISLAANGVAMLLFALATHLHALWILFVGRILAGATSGNIGACQAAIADVADGPERVTAMGKLGAGIGLGMMLGPWIGGQASRLGEIAPPLAAGLFAFVALAGVYAVLPETNPVVRAVDGNRAAGGREGHPDEIASPVSRKPRVSLRALSANPGVVVVMAVYFLTFLYMTNLQTSLALLAVERFQFRKDHVGDLFGLFGFVSLVVQFVLIGPVSKRVSPVLIVVGAGLMAAAGMLSIALTPIALGVVLGIVFIAAAVGFVQPTLAALASAFAGRGQQGTVLGLSQSSGSLGRAVGPIMWGTIYQHVGPSAAFLGGFVAALGASAVALGARRRREAE